MKGLVSVIIPVYNRQNVVEECVQSVLSQSYQNLQVILIDDGSSDRTVEVCKSLGKRDGRVMLLTMDHGGVSAARNRGLEEAEGEYVFFIDSDDAVHPRLLETLVDGLEHSEAGIAGTGVVNVPEERWAKVAERIKQESGPGETTYQSHEETIQAVFRWTTPINLIGGVMMRRDLVGQTRFRTDLHIGEDYQFIYENLIKGASSVFLKQKWYYCRIHTQNSSWDYSYQGFWTRFYRREMVWKSEEGFGRTENVNCQKRDAVGIFIRFLERNGWKTEDSRMMRQTVKRYYRELVPALSFAGKVQLWLGLYYPSMLVMIRRLRKAIRR